MNLCYRSLPSYIEREVNAEPRVSFVGSDAAPGIRVRLGPIVREEYWGDEEPAVKPGGALRPHIWHRHTRQNIPTGWRLPRLAPSPIRHGWVDLSSGAGYEHAWSAHARRHLRAWKAEQNEWQIVEPTVEEFEEGMRRTKKDPLLKLALLGAFRHALRGHGALLHLRAARRNGGPLETGLATLDIPEAGISLHQSAFSSPSMRNSSVGFGLIAEWFDRALTSNFEALHMGVLAGPGAPKSWEGFSRFKSQFGTQVIDYPPPLIHWSGSLLKNICPNRSDEL